MPKKFELSDFIEKANLVHNNFYDYSKVDYKNGREKVSIICPIHGQFEQIAKTHIAGAGCILCGRKNMIEKVKTKLSSNTSEFIEKANLVHNNFYDYSKVDYKNAHTDIVIICPIHGEFKQKPYSHLGKRSCPICANNKRNDWHKLDTETFISRAQQIHQHHQYDYSKVDYKTNKTPVIIICPIHGEFKQRPDNHLASKIPCLKCSRQNQALSNTIYSSKEERTLESKLSQYNIIRNTRNVIYPYELDLFIPEHNLAIEINGIYWHSEIYKGKFYHRNKHKLCLQKGIKLLQFYDQEINEKLDWVLEIINKTISSKPIQNKILINNRIDSVLNYPGYKIIKEYEPVLEEKYSGNYCHKIWNSGYTLLERI